MPLKFLLNWPGRYCQVNELWCGTTRGSIIRDLSVSQSLYLRHRFPSEIISQCVWLYFCFSISYREVEELMLMRGVVLIHETVRYLVFEVRTGLCQRPAQPVSSIRRQMAPGMKCFSSHGRVHYL